MSFFRWILALPIIVGVVLFALAHPEPVEVSLTPFNEPKSLPLYFVVILFLGIGFLLGAFVAWIGMIPVWKDRRSQRKTIRKLEQDLNEANEKLINELSRQRDEDDKALIDSSPS